MNPKTVSVIIPNYNYARFLSEAIESVLAQSYKPIEIIVVNNGSTDNSLEVLNSFENRIRIIDQPNLGQSGSRNSGLSQATGEYIAFLDADDIWHPKKIEKQLKLLSNTTRLVYSGIIRFNDSDRTEMYQQLPIFRGDCSEYFLSKPGVSIVLSGESTAIFSRTLINEVGNFDGDLNSAAGWDFFRRCSRYSSFDFVPEPLTYYRAHGSNLSNSNLSNISDIRKAYRKLFADEKWVIPQTTQKRIQIDLEFTFLKTHIKALDFINTLDSLRRLRNYFKEEGNCN